MEVGGAGMERTLRLCWSDDVVEEAAFLLEPLREILGCAVERGGAFSLLREEFHAARGQVRAADLLRRLCRLRPPRGLLLAVTGADLYAPGMNFVFGEADRRWCCALVSTARLREGTDPVMLRRRLLVEAVHEVGHLLGLGHCRLPPCAMHFSVAVEEVDRKGARFCPECRARLG